MLSARALYACQLRSQCRPSGIDTEFGLRSSVHVRGGHEATLVLAGMGVSQSEDDELEQGEEIEMGGRLQVAPPNY